MGLRELDDDVLARVMSALKVSRRQAKLELHEAGLPSTSADLSAAIVLGRKRMYAIRSAIERYDMLRRKAVEASEEVAAFEPPRWLWAQDADYEDDRRWLICTGSGWMGLFAVVPSKAAEGLASMPIPDSDDVLVVLSWMGKALLPQMKGAVLEEAAEVASRNYEDDVVDESCIT